MVDGRPELPFDAERTPAPDGSWAIAQGGKVFVVHGWYYTSFQGRCHRAVYKRGVWTETDEVVPLPVDTMLLIQPEDVAGLNPKQVERMRWERHHNGPASEYSKREIARHRAAVLGLNLPRDGGDFRRLK